MKEQLKMATPYLETSREVPPFGSIVVYDRLNQSAGNSGNVEEEDLHDLSLTVSTWTKQRVDAKTIWWRPPNQRRDRA